MEKPFHCYLHRPWGRACSAPTKPGDTQLLHLPVFPYSSLHAPAFQPQHIKSTFLY